jgi:hypothetical protein
MRDLRANAGEMRAVAERAEREAAAVLAGEGTTEREPGGELAALAEHDPAAAMDEIAAKKDALPYDEKLPALLAALERDPSMAARLGDAGLSPGEKLAVGLNLARKEPGMFLRAVESDDFGLTLEEKKAVMQDIIEQDTSLFSEAIARFRMAHEDVVDVIGRYGPDDRANLLKWLKIPAPDGTVPYTEFSHQDMAWFAKEGRMSRAERERFEKVEGADQASRALMFAIEAAFPDRADAERERFRAEQELLRPIVAVGELGAGSANKPLYVQIEGRTLPAVYKPAKREADIRSGIKAGEMAGREALASFIDRALQLDVVPPTVLRDGPEGLGAVQDWKVGEIAYKMGDGAYTDDRHEQLKRVGFLDWLTKNSDRHNGNWLVSPDGKHQAIDNGSIFGEEKNLYDKVRSWPLAALHHKGDTSFPPELRAKVERLLGAPKVMAALKIGFEATLSPTDAERAWKEFEGKLLDVAADKDWALPNTDWVDFPKH